MSWHDFSLNGIQEEVLNHCIKCSICQTICPVSRVNPSFPGPKQVGPDWLRRYLAGEETSPFHPAVVYCSNCKSCETACPSGVPVATINQLAKERAGRYKRGCKGEIFLLNPVRSGKMASLWPAAVNWLMQQKFIRKVTERVTGLAAEAPFPSFSSLPLRRRLQNYRQNINPAGRKGEMVYFPGCYAEYMQPEVGLALIKLANQAGYEVILPPQVRCCGQPALAVGRLDLARQMALANLQLLRPYCERGVPIVFSCPSCFLTLGEEYITLLNLDQARQLAPLLYDAGEFFLAELPLTQPSLTGLSWPPAPGEEINAGKNRLWAYHEPCHLRASGVGQPGLKLLQRRHLNVVHLNAGCCGLAGSYGLKVGRSAISRAIGENVHQQIEAFQPAALVTECGMCATQLSSLTGLPVYHPLVLLSAQHF